jgi:hypothetical protein
LIACSWSESPVVIGVAEIAAGLSRQMPMS